MTKLWEESETLEKLWYWYLEGCQDDQAVGSERDIGETMVF